MLCKVNKLSRSRGFKINPQTTCWLRADRRMKGKMRVREVLIHHLHRSNTTHL